MDVQDAAGPSQLRQLLDAVMSVASDLDLETTLSRITEAAVRLADATYGALGVLDESRTHLARFLTVGIDPETHRRIGEFPTRQGILGTLITDPQPLRLADLRDHPDSLGFPANHPQMTSFLGVPVMVSGEAYGNLYLCDKADGGAFTKVDEDLITTLAAAAGVAIDNARLHARVAELALLEDRDRIARDLHDTVIQRIFAVGMSLQGAVGMTSDPALLTRIDTAVDELDETVREIRAAIFELHEARLPGASVRQGVLSLARECERMLGFEPTVRFSGAVDTRVDGELADDLLAVIRESLTNTAKHAAATSVDVSIVCDTEELSLVVEDDGIGSVDRTTGGLGIANMEARARRLGGSCSIESILPTGVRLRWTVPLI
jgi:signal transduction histidine kinase